MAVVAEDGRGEVRSLQVQCPRDTEIIDLRMHRLERDDLVLRSSSITATMKSTSLWRSKSPIANEPWR